MKKKRSRLIIIKAILMVLGALPGQSALPGGQDPFQPVVSRPEAELLTATMDVALTNASAAAAQLLDEINEDSSAALDFALGNLYFQEEQYDAAVKAYRTALEKMPLFRRARENLGRVYLIQQKPDEAIALYQTLVEDGQASSGILLLLGHALMMQEAAVSAENAYRQALLLQVENREALFGLSRSLIVQERYREAAVLLNELLQDDPENRDAWALRVNVLLARDKQEKALCAIEEARRLGAVDAELLAALGDLYINRNQPAEAVDAYRKAFAEQENPSVTRMLRAVEGMLMLQQTEYAGEMIGHVERRMQEDEKAVGEGDAMKLLRLKSSLARLQNHPQQAEELCRQILQQNPRDAETMLILGSLLNEQDKPEEALIQYERAARIPGFEARSLLSQAQIEVARERYDRAAQLLERAQAFDNRPHVARYLEQILRMTGESSSF